VAAFGVFVELDNSIEGMVHVSYLEDDYYHYNEKQYVLIGERTGRSFRIGDRVKIKVEAVNKAARTIDFRMAEGGEYLGKPIHQERGTKGTGKHERKRKKQRGAYQESADKKSEKSGLKVVAKKAAKVRKKKKVKV
jgi:ribonuclease R